MVYKVERDQLMQNGKITMLLVELVVEQHLMSQIEVLVVMESMVK